MALGPATGYRSVRPLCSRMDSISVTCCLHPQCRLLPPASLSGFSLSSFSLRKGHCTQWQGEKNCKPKELLFLQTLSASSHQTHGVVVSLILQLGKRHDIHQLHIHCNGAQHRSASLLQAPAVPQRVSWPVWAFTASGPPAQTSRLCRAWPAVSHSPSPPRRGGSHKLSKAVPCHHSSLIRCPCSSPPHWETMTLHWLVFFSRVHGLTLPKVMPAAATQEAI